MKQVYIAIKHKDGEDVIQYANSIEQAQKLIDKVLPPLKSGFSYIIKK